MDHRVSWVQFFFQQVYTPTHEILRQKLYITGFKHLNLLIFFEIWTDPDSPRVGSVIRYTPLDYTYLTESTSFLSKFKFPTIIIHGDLKLFI